MYSEIDHEDNNYRNKEIIYFKLVNKYELKTKSKNKKIPLNFHIFNF